jgi:hypothetical protein
MQIKLTIIVVNVDVWIVGAIIRIKWIMLAPKYDQIKISGSFIDHRRILLELGGLCTEV